MLTLKQALELPDNSNASVEVKVIDCREACQESTNKKKYFEAIIADKTGSANIKVFQENQHEKFMQKPSLLLQDIIKKTDSFIFTVKSKAPYCAPVPVDLNPTALCVSAAAKTGTVEEVLKSPSKMDMVCRVIQSSPVKTRTSGHTGIPLKLKHLLVKDNSGTAKVALWEKAAEEEYEENSVIKIKHVRGTTFNKMHLIGTTNTSTVEFLSDSQDIPEITEEDKRQLCADADFTESVRFTGIVKAFDNICIYRVCNNQKCNNKQLTNNICATCGQTATVDRKYLRTNLTVASTSLDGQLQTLTMFYPEYCTLCAFLDKKPELTSQHVTANLSALLGKQINYSLRQSTIGNISIKRESDD